MAMTDEEKIAFIKLRIGDVPTNPLYPIFTDDEYQLMLDACGGDVDKATRMAAIGAAMQVSTISTREQIDDLVIENDLAANYMKALDYLIKNPVTVIPAGLMPWIATSDCDRVEIMDVGALSCGHPRSKHRKTCCGG